MEDPVYELRISRLINGWLIREDYHPRDNSVIGRAWVAMTEDQLAALVRELVWQPRTPVR